MSRKLFGLERITGCSGELRVLRADEAFPAGVTIVRAPPLLAGCGPDVSFKVQQLELANRKEVCHAEV